MKIAIQDANVWLPRTNTWLYNQVVALAGNWRAEVVSNRTDNLSEFPYPHVFSLRDQVSRPRWALETALRRARLTAHAPTISRYCHSLNADLLHSHFATIGWHNLRLAKQLKLPHVVTFYGFDVTQVPREKGWRERYVSMFEQVTRVLCEGPHMAQEIEKLGCPAAKLSVHRLGVQLDRLPYSARTAGTRPPRFFMAGSFREKKGLTDGMQALGEFARRRPDQPFELNIVGGPGVGEEGESIKQELRRLAQHYGIEDRVHYAGFLSHADLITLASKQDIFLCPSVMAANGDTEGGAPVVMIEMAAMGLPVLGTHHCDMPHVVGERNRALLVGERDVEALSLSIEKLVDSPDDWPQISEQNRAHCDVQFDCSRQGERLAAVYDDVIQSW